MKSKKYHNQGREFLFVIAGVIIALILAVMVVILIRRLVIQSSDVFGPPSQPADSVIRFNFDEYERLIGDLPKEE